MRTRTPSAARISATWVLMFLLLQLSLVSVLPAVHAVPIFTVSMKHYLPFYNSRFKSYPDGNVTYANAIDICTQESSTVPADQHAAAHNAISETMRLFSDSTDDEVYAFLGGDFLHSIDYQVDEKRKCRRGLGFASWNCIYRWNQGGFLESTDPEFSGIGVPFFKTTLHNLSDRTPLNGFPSYWKGNYPMRNQPFLIGNILMKSNFSLQWMDSHDAAYENGETRESSYGAVCAIQGTNTISLTLSNTRSVTYVTPPTPTGTMTPTLRSITPSLTRARSDNIDGISWGKRNWWWIFLLILLVIVLLCIVLFLVHRACSRKTETESRSRLMSEEHERNVDVDMDEFKEEDGEYSRITNQEPEFDSVITFRAE